MERESVKKSEHPRDGGGEKNLDRNREGNMPGSGVLTNTPGSPKVPTPEEQNASPGADGQDNRINLDQKQQVRIIPEREKKHD